MTPTLYHVVSRNHGGTYTIWKTGTRTQCRNWILGNDPDIPPVYAITARTSDFHKCYYRTATPNITLSLYPNIRETLWIVYRDGLRTPFVVRPFRGTYVIDTFTFSYGEKPIFATLRQARDHLRGRWPPITPMRGLIMPHSSSPYSVGSISSTHSRIARQNL